MEAVDTVEVRAFRRVVGFPGYEVSQEGRVRGLNTERYLKPTNEKYPRVTLYGGEKPKMVPVHRVVALAWVVNPDPEKFTIVNHLDNNPRNYAANNLEWTTVLGNNLHAISIGAKPTNTGRRPLESRDPESQIVVDLFPSVPVAAFTYDVAQTSIRRALVTGDVVCGLTWHYQVDEIVDEEWKPLCEAEGIRLDYIQYSVSSHGRVKNTDKDSILINHLSSGTYYQVMLTHSYKKSRQFLVHRLVAAAFIPDRPVDATQVDHIDNSRLNNHWSNLQWISTKKHGMKTHCVRVRQEDMTGRLIAVHESVGAAADSVGVSHGGVSQVLQGVKASCAGYIWKRANVGDVPPSLDENSPEPVLKINGTTVAQKTLKGDVVAVYPTLRVAAAAVDGRADSISKAISRKFPTYKGFVWDKA